MVMERPYGHRAIGWLIGTTGVNIRFTTYLGEDTMCLKHYLFILITLLLSGCNIINLQPTASNDLSEYVEIQKRADEAYKNEDWKSAEKDYSYLAKNIPANVEPWFRLGNIYARTNQLDAAVAAYREALIRDQKNSKIWHNLGIVQLRQATNTFIEMQGYIEQSDPLNQRAKYVVNSVSEIMSGGFGPAGVE